jgi:hypothetical protein
MRFLPQERRDGRTDDHKEFLADALLGRWCCGRDCHGRFYTSPSFQRRNTSAEPSDFPPEGLEGLDHLLRVRGRRLHEVLRFTTG